jgi:hypothetical protein
MPQALRAHLGEALPSAGPVAANPMRAMWANDTPAERCSHEQAFGWVEEVRICHQHVECKASTPAVWEGTDLPTPSIIGSQKGFVTQVVV